LFSSLEPSSALTFSRGGAWVGEAPSPGARSTAGGGGGGASLGAVSVGVPSVDGGAAGGSPGGPSFGAPVPSLGGCPCADAGSVPAETKRVVPMNTFSLMV